tara:strand:+ start:35677 stop:36177 length:501 start_codon:yes stop_codon:yes gene_type:complete
MVVVETISAVMMVKSAIEGISAALETTKDISGLYKGIDALFHGRDAMGKEGDADEEDLSVEAIAKGVLLRKALDRKILNLGIRIDNKFGRGTWDEIVATREERVKARDEKLKVQKARQAVEKEEQEERRQTILKVLKEIGIFLALALILTGVAWAIWRLKCREGTC